MPAGQTAELHQDTDFRIDDELSALIPPLTDEERMQLESNLVADGCRDPLVVWKEQDILLDGHHRLSICREHRIAFDVRKISLPDRDAAKVWLIRNQFGRRNLTPYQRAELALALEPLVAAKAKENERRGGGSGPSDRQKSADPVETRAELAKVAGVSHDTIAKAKFLDQHADKRTKEQLRKGEVSIHAAYKAARKDKQRDEKARAKSAVPAGLPAVTDRYKVIPAEFQRADMGIASTDWIITDPPYAKQFLSLYADLSEFAARVLKPDRDRKSVV